MNQIAAPLDEETVASPCINICTMNAVTDLCNGCQRSLEEIASWSMYDPAEKRAVLALLPGRKPTK